jgi:hypothetical protein
MRDALARRVRFAGFELNLKAGELRGGGETVRLPEKPFRVLLTPPTSLSTSRLYRAGVIG